jgi:coatomer subunit beta
VRAAVDAIQEGLGPLPLLPQEAGEDGDDAADAKDKTPAAVAQPISSKRPAVLADGTYATQAAVLEVPLPAGGAAASAPNLRALLLGGDFFLGGVVATALTKLVLRLRTLGVPRAAANRASAAAMLSIASILRLGEWSGLPSPLDDDSRERMATCLEVLARPQPEMVKVGWG